MSNPYSKKIERRKKKEESEFLREFKKKYSKRKIVASEWSPEITNIDEFIEGIFQRLKKEGYNPFDALMIIYGEDWFKKGKPVTEEQLKKLFPD